MGISGKHVLKTFGPYKDIKVRYVAPVLLRILGLALSRVRFSGVVYPGETLVTEMWKEGDKVIFGKPSGVVAAAKQSAEYVLLVQRPKLRNAGQQF